MQGLERVIYTQSVQRPQPHITNYRKKEEKGKNIRRQNGTEQLWPIKRHWPCYCNPPVPYRRIEGEQDRSTGTLRGAQVHRCVARTGTYSTGRKPQRRCIGLHLTDTSFTVLQHIDTEQCHTQTHPS